ncbi:MAG: GatB/YqeY domain-containing protein [Betaproteobacteria bacterium]|nr:GatB/YqeY domain-containing protein [Betaproteobacteria bacterium]
MSDLRTTIHEDMKAAMRAKDAPRLAAVRLLIAAIKQREIDERAELGDGEVVAVIDKMLKQRRDSIAQYEAANRQDLADVEKFEMSVLQAYMPAALGDDELDAAIGAAIAETGAAGPQAMGKVMGLLKPRLAGRADMTRVSQMVKARLSGA